MNERAAERMRATDCVFMYEFVAENEGDFVFCEMVNIQISFHPHILINMHVLYGNDWCLSASGRFHLWLDEAHTHTNFVVKYIYTTLIRYFTVLLDKPNGRMQPRWLQSKPNPEKYEHILFGFGFKLRWVYKNSMQTVAFTTCLNINEAFRE